MYTVINIIQTHVSLGQYKKHLSFEEKSSNTNMQSLIIAMVITYVLAMWNNYPPPLSPGTDRGTWPFYSVQSYSQTPAPNSAMSHG